MIESFQTLTAAIVAEYFTKGEWISWAEQSMLAAKTVDGWLVDLYDAVTANDALAALGSGWQKSGWPEGLIDQTSLVLGFLYLRYQDAGLSISGLLYQAGDLTDRKNYDEPACEAFYLLLNKCEGGVGATYNATEFEKEVKSIFSKHAENARQRLAALKFAA